MVRREAPVPKEEIVPNRLLVSLDRSLAQRARANAAAAVRSDARHAAERREAVSALLAQPEQRSAAAFPR
jgi:hypothetical protein